MLRRPLGSVYAPSMCHLCALDASSKRRSMHPLCALYVPSMHPLYAPSICAPYVPSMRPL